MITHVRNLQYLLCRRVVSSCCSRRLLSLSSGGRLSKAEPFPKGTATQPLNEEPIKFFGSRAATYRAKETHSGGADETLWYQQYVISASVAAFMVYFCYLREENDIDRKLEGSLFDHIDGLEEHQLVVSYKYNLENGIDTKDIENRLLELGIDVRKLDQ